MTLCVTNAAKQGSSSDLFLLQSVIAMPAVLKIQSLKHLSETVTDQVRQHDKPDLAVALADGNSKKSNVLKIIFVRAEFARKSEPSACSVINILTKCLALLNCMFSPEIAAACILKSWPQAVAGL